MKSIAYAIVASTCFTLSCFTPKEGDQAPLAFISLCFSIALILRKEAS